jgi:hypothetical protein
MIPLRRVSLWRRTIHAAVVKIHYTNGDVYEAEEPEYMTITME